MMKVSKSKGLIFICYAFIFLIANPLPVIADIYMHIDRNGVMHFTNTPVESEDTSDKYLFVFKEEKYYLKEETPEESQNQFTENIDTCIAEASNRHDVSLSLIKAIIKVESDFNPTAISNKGAMGLMQIMPFNFEELSITDPFDPWENINGGVRYFKNMLNKFNGDLSLSLAAYNAGPNAVDKYGNIPPYPETISYVDKVLKYYSLYQKKDN